MAKRKYGQDKHKIIRRLYLIQGHKCPLCKQSLHEDMRQWVLWREQRFRDLREGERKVKRRHVNLNIDHIIAVADGGSDDFHNLALTHKRCNLIRGTLKLYDERPRYRPPLQ